jgi:hypothetical protein
MTTATKDIQDYFNLNVMITILGRFSTIYQEQIGLLIHKNSVKFIFSVKINIPICHGGVV